MSLRQALLAIALGGCLASGCAAPGNWPGLMRRPAPPAPQSPGAPAESGSVAQDRATRQAEALQAFENAREQTKVQAALARWQEGNWAAGQQLLLDVLRRQPQHREAHLLLADFAAENGDLETAESHLQTALAAAPADAELHHRLGMLLSLQERGEEAERHFQEAVRLAPQNELYRLSCGSPRFRVND